MSVRIRVCMHTSHVATAGLPRARREVARRWREEHARRRVVEAGLAVVRVIAARVAEGVQVAVAAAFAPDLRRRDGVAKRVYKGPRARERAKPLNRRRACTTTNAPDSGACMVTPGKQRRTGQTRATKPRVPFNQTIPAQYFSRGLYTGTPLHPGSGSPLSVNVAKFQPEDAAGGSGPGAGAVAYEWL